MNRGVLRSSPVQQLMAAVSPNNMRPPVLPPPQSSPFLPAPPLSSWYDNQEVPESWSQLLMGGLMVEEDKSDLSHLQLVKKLENWEEQLLQQQAAPIGSIPDDIKPENSSNSYYVFGSNNINAEFQAPAQPTNWPQMMPVSYPKSCVTSLVSYNMLDFSNNTADGRHPLPDRSSECNSTATGGAGKKARVQPSSSMSQTTFKGTVKKEKLGNRITALHQMVCPFGKTDTASVLLEALGYIRFLQSQIEALSLPYLKTGTGNNTKQQQQSVQGERNCLFPDDPGQLLNDNSCLEKKVAPHQNEEAKKDLKSKGLCLVPISCTEVQVGSDNGVDYWSSTILSGGGNLY